MEKGFSKFLQILIVCLCVIVNIIYFYNLQYKPQNLVSTAYYIGMQETQAGEKKPFLEINSYKDCFEIKFNYLMNNEKTAYYSQGLQYFGTIDFNNANRTKYFREDDYYDSDIDTQIFWFKSTNYYYREARRVLNYKNMTVKNYASDNDFSTSMISTNPINPDSCFKIQIGEELFEMRFKGVSFNSNYYIGRYWDEGKSSDKVAVSSSSVYVDAYRLVDVNEFAKILYEGVAKENLKSGTSEYRTLNFEDIFDFYKINKNTNKAESTRVPTNDLYKINVQNYITAKITRFDTKIKRASDSLFNAVDGNANYDTTGGDGDLSYFLGRTCVNLTEKQFLQNINPDGSFTLRLSEKFIKANKKYKTKIKLNITIDLDYIDSLGGTFKGIEQSSLSDFSIFQIIGTRATGEEVIKYA